MSFIWPAVLILLLVIPLGVAVYVMRERRRRARITATLGPLKPAVAPGGGRGRQIRRRSMAATDMAPTRMEAAKAAARTFVASQPKSIQIGVVAFSDAGFSVTVPTDDQSAVLAAIDRLGPERGTSIARGILSSMTAIATADRDPEAGYYTNTSPDPNQLPPVVTPGTFAPAAIVLLSDGENNQQPDPIGAARGAADRGIRIFTVGLGTQAGTTLEVEGFRVHSALDASALRQIADITDGTYYAASEPNQLKGIYDDIETRFVIRPEATE